MLDLTAVVGFDWDAGNEHKSLEKHSVSQREAESVFDCPALLVQADVKHSQIEPRYHALGESCTRRLMHVTFTLRAEATLIRIISARDMNAKERALYAKEA
jgi:uncharacterized DUF497 family protein